MHRIKICIFEMFLISHLLCKTMHFASTFHAMSDCFYIFPLFAVCFCFSFGVQSLYLLVCFSVCICKCLSLDIIHFDTHSSLQARMGISLFIFILFAADADEVIKLKRIIFVIYALVSRSGRLSSLRLRTLRLDVGMNDSIFNVIISQFVGESPIPRPRTHK